MKTKITKEGWHIIEGDTHVGSWIESSGKLDHDTYLIPIACDNIPVGGIVIDCGALYGDHSIAYARKVGAQGAVFCIEPNKVAFECLTKNAEKFESPVFLLNAVVCQEHGSKALHQVLEGNVGASIVTEDEIKGVVIPTVSIDGLVKDATLDRVDFIKIDCEGYEYEILLGAKGTLKTLKPKLLIEINQGALAEQGACDKDIYDLLLELRYEWRIVQPDCTGSSVQFDIMAWPNQIQVVEKKIIS